MKQALILILISTLLVCSAHSQDTIYLGNRGGTGKMPAVVTNRAPQAIYGELYGRGLIFSFNYDSRFQKTLDGLGFSVGAGGIFAGDVGFVTIPVSINNLSGSRGHYFESGAGFTYTNVNFNGFDDPSSGNSTIIGTLTFGYRSQPVHGGLNFRAGLNVLIASGLFLPYPYISLGYNF